jgi:hypothetical protein
VKPSYLMWLEWKDGRISFIRDYRYVRYVIDDAELVLTSEDPRSSAMNDRAGTPTHSSGTGGSDE